MNLLDLSIELILKLFLKLLELVKNFRLMLHQVDIPYQLKSLVKVTK
jgi:hypothetical protein